jgi:hypothetical protein
VVSTESCVIVGLRYPCDPATGACAAIEPCSSAVPYLERCVVGGAYRMVCHADRGFAIAEPCPGCVEDARGAATCAE